MKSLLQVGLIAAAASISSAALAAPPDYYPSDYNQIVEASKGEKGLLIYSNFAAVNWDPIIKAFNAEYPWIKVTTTDMGASEVFERYLADVGSNVPSADMLMSGAPLSWMDLLTKDVVQQYQSPETSKVPAWSISAPGVYTVSADPFVIAYNKLVLPESDWPKTMADILALVRKDPNHLQHKMGAYAPDANALTEAVFWEYLQHGGGDPLALLKEIGPQTDIYRSGGPVIEKLTSGEYVATYLMSAQAVLAVMADPNRQKLLGWDVPSDAAEVNVRNMAITKTSASPNSAKLMLDFIMSQKGQIAVGNGGLIPYRSDVDASQVATGVTYDTIAKDVGEKNIILITLDKAMPDGLKTALPQLLAAFQQQ
ncbi:MAG TPA: ABC transporter substrate-binding protein [Bauldia sp.]|nr:ABC transporter substrate-binding protein [Bauldia sp.]